MRLTKKMAYVALILSVVIGQIGTGCLEACQAFTRLTPTLALIVAYAVSYWCLSKALMLIDLSIAFATWLSVGTIGSALMGVFLFQQTISPVGWGAIIVMIVGVVLLNLYGTPKEPEGTETAGEQKK